MCDRNGYTYYQERLWRPIDGIVADQASNALSAMQRVIRDARIRVLPDQDLALRISNFPSRDDCGTAPDTILMDQQGMTDRMATHIRVIGEEIGEYIDHESAAEYGVVFTTRNVESLVEEEAYQEAVNSTKDSLGSNAGRRISMAAQLQYEPEDEIDIIYTGLDGRSVNQACIINSVAIQYNRPALEMSLELRENYGV